MSVLRPLAAALREADALDLTLRLLLLALLLDAPAPWLQRLPVMLCAGAGLLLPGLLRRSALWVLLAALSAWPLVSEFPFPDNHDYLRVLACLAVTSALLTRAPAEALARGARWLVGGVFLLAVVWKLVLAPDFRDGTFFRVTLQSDARFENLVVLTAGESWSSWEANARAFGRVVDGGVSAQEAGFAEPPAVRTLALAATAGTLLLELWVAAAFLLPAGRRLSRSRDLALLLFAALTYPFATVRGFGWLLMALGLAQVEGSRWRTRLAYLVGFATIELLRSVPWDDALVQLFGRT